MGLSSQPHFLYPTNRKCHSERSEESPTRHYTINVVDCRLRGNPSLSLGMTLPRPFLRVWRLYVGRAVPLNSIEAKRHYATHPKQQRATHRVALLHITLARSLLLKTHLVDESLSLRLVAAEVLIESHRMLVSTALQYLVAELACNLLREDTLLAEV